MSRVYSAFRCIRAQPAGAARAPAPEVCGLTTTRAQLGTGRRPRACSAYSRSRRRMTAPRRTSPQLTLACLALAGVSYSLMQSLVAPALPVIQTDLHASARGVSWIFTAYLLSASIATPLIGRLGDIHGKQRVLVWVMVLLFVGTLLSALATAILPMIVGRIVQGVAGGL